MAPQLVASMISRSTISSRKLNGLVRGMIFVVCFA
jgi:hypothetical protein